MSNRIVWTEGKVKKLLIVYGMRGLRRVLTNHPFLKGREVLVIKEDNTVLPIEDYLKELVVKAK